MFTFPAVCSQPLIAIFPLFALRQFYFVMFNMAMVAALWLELAGPITPFRYFRFLRLDVL